MGRIFGGLAIGLIGLGMLWGSVALTRSTLDFRANAVASLGTVVDFETETETSDGKRRTMYRPVVEFQTADGQTIRFASSSSSSSPSYDRGEQVPVLYSQQTPERAQIDSFMENWFGPLILAVLGLVAALVGWALFFGGIRLRRVRGWLQNNGQRVQARVLGVEENPAIRVNGKLPWRVRAQWQNPSTGQNHLFYSDNYWYDPSPLLDRESVDALVNPADPTQYTLDTSFLPKRA